MQIDLVLTGTDGLSAGIAQNLWVELLPDYYASRPAETNYLPPAAKMQELAQGHGVVIDLLPLGAADRVQPRTVTDPPTTAEELLAWAKAHPERFQYARPGQLRPRPHPADGLPYLLGDTRPEGPRERLGQDLGVPARSSTKYVNTTRRGPPRRWRTSPTAPST